MITQLAYNRVINKFSENIRNEISLGHISRSCYSSKEIKQLNKKYPELTYTNEMQFEDVSFFTKYTLFGEESHEYGILALFISDESYIFPSHTMTVQQVQDFINECLKNHPELFI